MVTPKLLTLAIAALAISGVDARTQCKIKIATRPSGVSTSATSTLLSSAATDRGSNLATSSIISVSASTALFGSDTASSLSSGSATGSSSSVASGTDASTSTTLTSSTPTASAGSSSAQATDSSTSIPAATSITSSASSSTASVDTSIASTSTSTASTVTSTASIDTSTTSTDTSTTSTGTSTTSTDASTTSTGSSTTSTDASTTSASTTSASSAAPCIATNLAANPGADTSSKTPWTSSAGTFVTMENEYVAARSSPYYFEFLMLKNPGTNRDTTWISQTVSGITKGKTYDISVWLGLGGTPRSSIDNVKLYAIATDDTGDHAIGDPVAVPLGAMGQWSQAAWKHTALSDGESIMFKLIATPVAGATTFVADVILDDVVIAENCGTPSTTFIASPTDV